MREERRIRTTPAGYRGYFGARWPETTHSRRFAAALYRGAAGGKSKTSGDRIRQLRVQLRPTSALTLRAGRQDIKLGTEVMYPEGNWKYLKIVRLSQRLEGTVGWTRGERSSEGLTAAYDFGDDHLYACGAKPTTGVFESTPPTPHRTTSSTAGSSERVSLLAGYSCMWGHGHSKGLPDDDSRFAFFRVAANY